MLPPTRLLPAGSFLIDPFVLAGAVVGAAWRAERGGAAGAVYHSASGAIPAVARVPVVATLLDLAPWELPARFGRGPLSRLGLRLRSGLLRHADAVIVGSNVAARLARSVLRVPRSRLHVVPLAARPEFQALPAGETVEPDERSRQEQERLGLPARYLVYSGRYDARQDLPMLLEALGRLAAAGRPASLDGTIPWPPRVLLVGAPPDDRAALARVAAVRGLGETIAYAPRLEPARLASLVRGARAAVMPVRAELAGLPVIEALAVGIPVVASSVGVLPELVGHAGLLVPPADADRLAIALSTVWVDDGVHAGIAAAARASGGAASRTWLDVAAETRQVYAEAAERHRREGPVQAGRRDGAG
jgi:glycosyltransferase involved in cell wall biosynthesis